MSSKARGGSDASVSGAVYSGEDAPEVVRLRRENAQLRQQLVARERERDHLITRYEALVPDGDETEENNEANRTDEADRARHATDSRRRWLDRFVERLFDRLLPARLRP